uniref:CARD domain-containing protein n=1 Tax=Neogobius melanostomus TaxID=47308 RepID=A0A8C6SUK4_9GOBI
MGWRKKSAIKAKDIIRRNKTSLLEILSADHMLILNKVQELSLISDREYNNLKGINNKNVEGHVIELLDKLLGKGEETCQNFIKLLKTDDMIQETFPKLKLQLTVDNSKLVLRRSVDLFTIRKIAIYVVRQISYCILKYF